MIEVIEGEKKIISLGPDITFGPFTYDFQILRFTMRFTDRFASMGLRFVNLADPRKVTKIKGAEIFGIGYTPIEIRCGENRIMRDSELQLFVYDFSAAENPPAGLQYKLEIKKL